MLNILENQLLGQGLSETLAMWIGLAAALAMFALIIGITRWSTRRFLLPVLERAIHRSAGTWDDTLANHHFFKRLANLAPVVAVYFAGDLTFAAASPLGIFCKRSALIVFVIISIRVIDALLQAAHDIYTSYEVSKGRPIRGYVQALSIVIYIMAAIFIVAIATNQSPWGILTVFGGLTAVLLLVFKDTILGLVAGIQLNANDMVRIGDWIEMPKYGADGDVFDISINTIKVQNWDKTIATIPTYALITDSFKNWRGMSESGGRRIKRSLFIDMQSIKFCSKEMLAHFAKISLLKNYLAQKKNEIETYNNAHQFDQGILINGRRQTNIGVFRAYIVNYLRQHPKIHQEMTFLVRQLQPTPQGLPLEIYVFCNDQAWANYEAIQADIFDHILAAVPEFELRIFQYPSGHDLHHLLSD
ncbi:MAG: mechanosensitive ion channel family protein [Desulfobulbaceae bacterium]|nr:mechanosensitive ion channel family protein [Desulfobulbaceae bacterium]HIJ79999.1 mechanosensitive ion channel family protein [Deltaproteobacteria bacterium]